MKQQSKLESSQSIIRRAIERHGGASAISSIGSIRIRLTQVAGIVLRFKGLGLTFSLPEQVVVNPNGSTAEFLYPDQTIVYENGAVSTNGATKPHYRKSFSGFRKLRFWTPSDACYFFGYALTGYFSLPFSLEGLEVLRHGTLVSGESWVECAYPSGADTHSQVQRFWFDRSGLLIRHDYCADIIGPFFWGAHFSSNYCHDFSVPLARTRTVRLRLGRISFPLTVLSAKLEIESVES